MVEVLEELQRSLPEQATQQQQPMQVEKRPKRVAKRRAKPLAQDQQNPLPEEKQTAGGQVAKPEQRVLTPQRIKRVAKRRGKDITALVCTVADEDAEEDKENVKPLTNRLKKMCL